jgi:hypothetical protein
MISERAHESETAESQPAVGPDASPSASESSETPAPAGALPPEAPDSALWPARLTAATAASHEWVTRPRVRLSLTGAVLLLTGALLTTNSVWTLPLVIVGGLMVVVAWIGHRLEGRFAIEWGETGTQLAFRATVKPARPAGRAPLGGAAQSPQLASAHELVPEPAQIIDGEAHTVEIDVAELKALIAAVETTEAETAPHAPAPQGIHIRRVAYDAARSPDAAG